MIQALLDRLFGRRGAPTTPVPPPPPAPSWRADVSRLRVTEPDPEPQITLDPRIVDDAWWSTEFTRTTRASELERGQSLAKAYEHVKEEFERRGLRDRVISIVVVEHQVLVLKSGNQRGRTADDFTHVVMGVMRSATSAPQIIVVDEMLRVYVAGGRVEAITSN